MDTAIPIGGPDSGKTGGFDRFVDYAVEAEKLGVASLWTAEAWGMDAVAPLAFIAARTKSMRVGTAIMQVSARAPVMTAMTALSLAAITEGRFILGLGVSGPQVVEGLHGVPFDKPMGRLGEYVDIVRLALAGEPVVYRGVHYELPRPGGQGKALKLAQPANPDIPIYLATLGPRALALTGAIADGWLGTCFIPEQAHVYWDEIRLGASRAGRSLEGFAVNIPVRVGISENVEALLARIKPRVAFQLGAMGSPTTNFYNNAYRRIGFAEAAIEIQRLWTAGKHDEAISRVPDELILKIDLIGTESMIRERIRQYEKAGVTSLMVRPMGKTNAERLDTLGQVTEWVRQETTSHKPYVSQSSSSKPEDNRC